MGKITDVACMSLLWLITSLPVFTIGAATAAFYSFTMEAVQDMEGGVWHSFFHAFRKNFRKATAVWAVQLLLLVALTVNLYAAWNFYLAKGILGLGVFSLALFGMIVLLSTGVYLYPVMVTYDFDIRKIVSDSFVMAIRNPHVTISCMVLFILAGVGCYYLSGLFFFWFGLAIFFSSYFILGVFMKYAGIKVEKRKKKKKVDPYI